MIAVYLAMLETDVDRDKFMKLLINIVAKSGMSVEWLYCR